MVVNQSLSSQIGSVINEANKLLSDSKNVSQTNKTQKIESINENDDSLVLKPRITYGLVSLEIMSDEQYLAFERVTAGMSHNEKISVAQTLTRAGNLSGSVERVEQQEKEQKDKIDEKTNPIGFLGISKNGWEVVAKEFQENLNNLEGNYKKPHFKQLSSNYNDIMNQNQEAKTHRILREFSHAIHVGNIQIDTIG